MSNKTTRMSKKDKEHALVPRLRFPEFRDAPAWETRPGHQLFDSITNQASVDGLPVLAVTQELGAVPREEIDYHVSVSSKSIESYKEVCPGDFIISLRSFQGGIEYSSYHGICSPAYVILRQKFEGSNEFFRHYFKSERFIRQLTRNLEGLRDGKMISYRQFSEQDLYFPDHHERLKISDCLGSLDDVITAEGRKLAALRDHKNGLMQQLFPRECETRPRLRFPKFRDAGEWSSKSLKEVCDLKAGEFVRAADIAEKRDEGMFPCYGGNGLRGYVATFTHSGRFVLVGRQGALCGNVNLVDEMFHATEHALVATPKPNINVDWLYYALASLNLNRFATGQAQPGLSVSVLNEVDTLVPVDENEQQCIAKRLSALDARIFAQAEKLEGLRKYKRGLMQQLFPAPEDMPA